MELIGRFLKYSIPVHGSRKSAIQGMLNSLLIDFAIKCMLWGGPEETIRSISPFTSLFLKIFLDDIVVNILESGINKLERIKTSNLFQKFVFLLVKISEGTFFLKSEL